MAFNTPVLLIVWRRPDMVSRLISKLRSHEPSHIFVACDGARNGNLDEWDKVHKTRYIVEHKIDWHCQIETLYSDVNQGCRLGPENAINWFFNHVNEGIILEDDCLPHDDFLPYCAELLSKYRENPGAWMISGDNSAKIPIHDNFSYAFVQTPLIWGWATWKRAWSNYYQGSEIWSTIRHYGLEKSIYPCPAERIYRVNKYDAYFKQNRNDAWDLFWHLSVKIGRGLCVFPKHNLISNQGVGEDATHTHNHSSRLLSDTYPILPLIHPPFPFVDMVADDQVFSRVKGIKVKPDEAKHENSLRSTHYRIHNFLQPIIYKSKNAVKKYL